MLRDWFFMGRRLLLQVVPFFFFISGLSALSDFYWEEPSVFSPGAGTFPVAASNGDLSVVAWQETQDITAAGSGASGDGLITVSLAVKAPDGGWRFHHAVGGPYGYGGAEPAILSITMDLPGRILLAAAVSSAETELLISDDQGETFRKVRLNFGSETSVAPRIFSRSGGGYYLFISRGIGQSLDLYYARSEDGFSWSSFTPLVRDSSLTFNFLPTLSSRDNTDYVVFQSLVEGGLGNSAFQLFITSSSDGGLTWTSPRRITGSQSFSPSTAVPDRSDHQRPSLLDQKNRLYLVWERRYAAESPQIYGAFIREDGSIEGGIHRINTAGIYGNNPIAFLYEGEITVVWFDNRRGDNRVFLAQQSGTIWQNYDLSGVTGGDAIFARPVVDRDGLSLFWQGTFRGITRIYARFPDRSVVPPRLRPENFTPGKPIRGNRARISWTVPPDSSGIRGFSYVWSRSPEVEPPKQIRVPIGSTLSVEEYAGEDGTWYFTLIAQDYAGNWSPPVRLEYLRDTTAPPAVNIIEPPVDGEGYLFSNTFTLRWPALPVSDVAGYTWNLEYLGREPEKSLSDTPGPLLPISPPPPRIRGGNRSVSYTNQNNGIWSFTLAAVDEAGNIGEPSRIFLRTNKYVPHTLISYVDARQDDQGRLFLKFLGQGFTEDGAIRRVFLDLDGIPPYDREFLFDRGDFQIPSDREITLEGIDDLVEGHYHIGVEHPSRGLYLTGPLVLVDEIGTVKYGDYSQVWRPSWAISRERRWVFNMILPLLMAIMVFCGIGSVSSVRGIGTVMADSAVVQVEAAALMTGDLMPMEKKKRMKKIRTRGVGLRLKLASYTITLVLLVVLIVSAPLYYMMTRTQEETLLRGLWNRSVVLLEGLASAVQLFLPAENVLELGFLPDQSAAVPEVEYVTITGFGSASTIFDDYVWATNDPDILSKIDTVEFEPGISRLRDALSPWLEEIVRELNERAQEEVGDLSASIAALTQEGVSLALAPDPASLRRLEDIQVTTRSLDARLTERLAEISREVGSLPEFSTEYIMKTGSHRFILFKPVMYRQGMEDIYFRGLIRLEISLDSIMEQISRGQRTLLELILVVAITALFIGILGALILSILLIRPIRKLLDHVALIRDTEDKSRLVGVDLHLNSGDEIALLGNTINDMTHSLVQASLASQDLSIGKEIQKKFIPLESNQEGNKLSFGHKETKDISFFGYYEGAKGVSGDYFDCLDLDGRYFAIIICDVAGKGIPAALIMIQVATMFLTYFKNWDPAEQDFQIEELAYQINDFIEIQSFKDRFAAFTLCLFDSQTGLARFCNAGDNIVHWYDAENQRIKTTTLRETPAIGVLPNSLVKSMGGYTVQTLTFNRGDILFLYTDGIEDAKRKFRDKNFTEILCTESPPDTPHGNHMAGQGNEALGFDRVRDIINAVMNKKLYSLYKYHNPEGEKKLLFDFTSCEGTVEEAILALVSVEKMFRCYRDPRAGEDSRVLVDKKVDHFLQDHFLQYREYCLNTRANPGNDAYMYYTHLKEEDQYDDLAILGIMHK
jgi:hypothetical protein